MKSGEKVVKAIPTICAMCKYRSGKFNNDGPVYCNYIGITGRSRIFEDRKKIVPDGYCDKFERGAMLQSFYKWSLKGESNNEKENFKDFIDTDSNSINGSNGIVL